MTAKEIEAWQIALATSLVQRNPNLNERDLNLAVPMILNRLIFLGLAEACGLEPEGHLHRRPVYERLCSLSGLFHFRPDKGRALPPDDLTLKLVIDNQPLTAIINSLYRPGRLPPLPSATLGQVYEQSLSKIIRLTTLPLLTRSLTRWFNSLRTW